MASVEQALPTGPVQANKASPSSRPGTPTAALAPAAGASPPAMKTSPSTNNAELSASAGETPVSVSSTDEAHAASKAMAYHRVPREDDNRKIFVGNLAVKTTEEGLASHFESVGKVESTKIIHTRGRGDRRFAFVVFESAESQKAAVETLNGTVLDEMNLVVQIVVLKDMNLKPASSFPRRPRLPRTLPNSDAPGEISAEGIGSSEVPRTRAPRTRRPRNRNPKPRDGPGAPRSSEENSHDTTGHIFGEGDAGHYGPNSKPRDPTSQNRDQRQFSSQRRARNPNDQLTETDGAEAHDPNVDHDGRRRFNSGQPRHPRRFSPRSQSGNGADENEGARSNGEYQQDSRNSRTSQQNWNSYPQRRRQPDTPAVLSETSVFVANISYKTTSEDLHEFFASQSYNVKEACIARDHFKKSKGFAFVEFNSSADQQRAVEQLHRTDFAGRKITIRIAIVPVKFEKPAEVNSAATKGAEEFATPSN